MYVHYINDTDSARKYFERTIKIEPNSTNSALAYINLAIMASDGGNLAKSSQYAEKAIKIMPNNDGFYYNYAHILSNMWKIQKL